MEDTVKQKLDELLAEVSRIESLGYDTVIQFCHETREYPGGHVFHITKPSGQSVVHSKAASKVEAIEQGILKFKRDVKV